MAGYGIADENNFGMHYWMLDVDMDCEQAYNDGVGHKWFELKGFIALMPGWERNIAQSSNPMPPYQTINHMGMCGMLNIFVANYPNLPAGLNPNSAQFVAPSFSYLSPVDERNAPPEALNKTPCALPGKERRCLGNLAQVCQSVGTGNFFQTTQNCTETPAGGNFMQMCQRSTGQCCTPGNGVTCQ
jgi:hypothetical protein